MRLLIISMAYLVSLISGNHDVDARNSGVNLNKGFAQCEHTYVNLETGKIDEEAIKQFQSSSELDLAKLRTQKNKWIMPSRYYSIRHKDEMEMFFIDANTLVDDFIEYYIDGKKKPNNQSAWLARAAKESHAKLKFLFMHQPPHSADKRTIASDHPDYLSEEKITLLKKHGITGNYNEILQKILFIQQNSEKGIDAGPGPEFATIFAAHTHAISYYNSKLSEAKSDDCTPMCQVITGGAGGELQNRFSFKDGDKIPTFMKDYGYVCVRLPDKNNPKLSFEIKSFTGHHLKFTNDSVRPIKKEREENLAKLSELVLAACEEYQIFIKENPVSMTIFQNKIRDWVPEPFIYSDELKNYFNRFSNLELNSSVEHLKTALVNSSSPTGLFGSLKFIVDQFFASELSKYYEKWHEIFNRALLKGYNISYKQFVEKPELILPKPQEPVVAAEPAIVPMEISAAPEAKKVRPDTPRPTSAPITIPKLPKKGEAPMKPGSAPSTMARTPASFGPTPSPASEEFKPGSFQTTFFSPRTYVLEDGHFVTSPPLNRLVSPPSAQKP